MAIRSLNLDEIAQVSGGQSSARGAACANSILFWSGMGSMVGSFGGVIGTIAGFAFGGGAAAKFAEACQSQK